MADKIFLQGDEISAKNIKKAISLLEKVTRSYDAIFAATSLYDISDSMRYNIPNHSGVRFLLKTAEEVDEVAGELSFVHTDLNSLKKHLTQDPDALEGADKSFRGYAERITHDGRVKKERSFWERLFGIDPQEEIEVVTEVIYDPSVQPDFSYYKTLSPHMGDYSMNQNDYRNTMGNEGCCAVAYAIALSIINKQPYNPDKYWDANERITKYKDGGIEYYNENSERPFDTNQICENIKEGKPIVIHYMYEENKGQHFVTVVGIREGAIISDLSYSDILAIDPATGTVRPLSDCYNFYPEGTKSMIVFK